MPNLLSKYVVPGCKVDLQAIDRSKKRGAAEHKIYQSQVIDVLSEDRIEISMPMEKSKLILLPIDGEYDLYFYNDSGLYQCYARVVDRYKNNSLYVLVLDLVSNLRKHQRREYYRFSCALEMNSRNLEEEEVRAIEERDPYNNLIPGLPLKRSVIVDISGGGLRFLSTHSYEPDSLIYISYNLLINGRKREYELVGKVLSSVKQEGRRDSYEHRVQYVDIETEVREEIIKYIFEEERKHRKRERLGS